MPFDYFAGAIFTTQELVTYCAGVFLLISMVLGLFLYTGNKFLKKFAPQHSKKIGFLPSILLASVIICIIVLFVFVVPTIIKDSSWRNKQATCAKQVGYASPADDNSDVATSASQSEYRQCLGL